MTENIENCKKDNQALMISISMIFVLGFAVFMAYLLYTGFFIKLVFLKENPALTKQFSMSYKGREFDSFKMSCGTALARSNIEISGVEFNLSDFPDSDICLYNPVGVGFTSELSSYLEITRLPGSIPIYKVRTTGEERKERYSHEIVEKLIKIVNRNLGEMEKDRSTEQSWIDAS